MSMSGIDLRPGFRKRSKRRSYWIGSMSVISRQYATSEPAAEPRPGPTPIPSRFAKRDEVPDDQEVVGEAHLADRLELELEPFLELGGHPLVALREPVLAELDEVVEGVAPVRGREVREQDPPSSIVTVQRSASSSVRASASG